MQEHRYLFLSAGDCTDTMFKVFSQNRTHCYKTSPLKQGSETCFSFLPFT